MCCPRKPSRPSQLISPTVKKHHPLYPGVGIVHDNPRFRPPDMSKALNNMVDFNTCISLDIIFINKHEGGMAIRAGAAIRCYMVYIFSGGRQVS